MFCFLIVYHMSDPKFNRICSFHTSLTLHSNFIYCKCLLNGIFRKTEVVILTLFYFPPRCACSCPPMSWFWSRRCSPLSSFENWDGLGTCYVPSSSRCARFSCTPPGRVPKNSSSHLCASCIYTYMLLICLYLYFILCKGAQVFVSVYKVILYECLGK